MGVVEIKVEVPNEMEESFKKIIEELVKFYSRKTNFKLFPNDALILATCKYYGTDLVSLDEDFGECCRVEGIKLIR